jgi:hypothetical protein
MKRLVPGLGDISHERLDHGFSEREGDMKSPGKIPLF